MKRTRKSRFLSMALAIVMAVGMLPFASITASAGLLTSEISEVKTTIDYPMAGQPLYMATPDVRTMPGGGYVNRYTTARIVNWWKGGTVDKPLGEKLTSGTYVAGETYIVNIEFTPHGEDENGRDYCFDEETEFIINNVKAKVYYKTLSGKYTCRQAFTVGETQISEISLSVDTPRYGMRLTEVGKTINTEGCRITNFQWHEGSSVDYPGKIIWDDNVQNSFLNLNDKTHYSQPYSDRQFVDDKYVLFLTVVCYDESDSPSALQGKYYFKDNVTVDCNGQKSVTVLDGACNELKIGLVIHVEDPIYGDVPKITVDEPIAWERPDFSAEIEGEGYTARVVKWYKGGTVEKPGNEIPKSVVFEAGETYIVSVEVNSKGGYYLRNTGYINGKEAKTELNYLYYQFTAKYPDSIKKVYAKVEEPYLGMPPSYYARIDSPLYTATVTDWYVGGTIDNPKKKISSTDVFPNDSSRFVDVRFEATGKIPFSKSPYPEFYINNEKAELRAVDLVNGYYVCRYKFPGGISPSFIFEFCADITQPLVGEKPVYTAETHSIAYTAKILEWYKTENNRDKYTVPGSFMESKDVFEECGQSHCYVAIVEFTPNDGFESDYYSVGTINGISCQMVKGRNNIFLLEFTPINFTGITGFSASVDSPVIGKLPTKNVSLESADYTAEVYSWSKGETDEKPGTKMTEGEAFNADDRYYVSVWFTVDNYKDIVANPTATVNGYKGYLYSTMEGGGEVTYCYRFGGFFANNQKVIGKADALHVVKPTVGQPPSDTVDPVAPFGEYSVCIEKWLKSNGTEMSYTEKFDYGQSYKVIVKFTPCDIYTFNESTTARINMKDAVREAYDPVTGEISFSYTFTVPADKTIYEVDVMGVTPPVAGEAPSFDFEIPEGVAYKKYADSRDDTCWWNEYTPGGDRLNTFTKSNYMGLSEEQMKFKPGYTYEFSTVLSYTDDNRFSNNVSATINYEPVAVGEETTTLFCYITQAYTCYTDAPRIVASKTVASRGEMVDFTVYLPPVKNLRSLNLNMMFAGSGLTVYPYSLKLNEGIKDKVDAGNFGIDMYGNLNLTFTEEYSKDGETRLLTFTCLVDENARGKVMFPFAAVLYAKEPYMDVYPIFADTDLMSEEITVSASVGGTTVGGGFVCGGGEYLTSFELIPQGTSAPAYATHEVGTLSGTSYSGTWSISNVADGIYTLRVSKKDHLPREYTVTVSGSEVTQNVELYLQGDVNGDGTVNTVDVILTLRHIAGWNVSIDQSSADFNGDGKIVTTDVILMLRRIAGWNV